MGIIDENFSEMKFRMLFCVKWYWNNIVETIVRGMFLRWVCDGDFDEMDEIFMEF